ncbi:MAG: di-heme oxidoredictase family protein [Terriglobia bacterium]
MSAPISAGGQKVKMVEAIVMLLARHEPILQPLLAHIANSAMYAPPSGQFTTMREAVLAHHGEAEVSRRAFRSLLKYDQDSIIEFLKSLQVLPPGTRSLCVDQDREPIACPPGIQP